MQETSIWTEKYRPSNFDDIKGQGKIVEKAEAFVKQRNMPHLLFAGPPGTGKTSLELVIAKKLFGDSWRDNFLELNSSVTGDTPILIKESGKIKRTNFGYLSNKYFSPKGEKRVKVNDINILSLNKNKKIEFLKVDYIFRHFVDEIVNIKYEGGKLKTSLSHSLMVINEDGNIVSKEAKNLRKGDLLITFKTEYNGNKKNLDITKYKSKEYIKLRSGIIKNPKFRFNLDYLPLDEDMSWSFGLYTAEGCTSLNSNKSGGQAIFTLNYPKELSMGNKLFSIYKDRFNINSHIAYGYSGFKSRSRNKNACSIQYRLLNTQLTKFFRDNFYNEHSDRLYAWSKRIPYFMFESSINSRKSFLRGYFDGDGCGKWKGVARISSRSKECLVDTVWLGRLSGLETSYFDSEARIIWKNKKFSYIKSELLPASIFEKLARKLGKTYQLRHHLYGKRCKRIRKTVAKNLLGFYKKNNYYNKRYKRLSELVASDISVVAITDIKRERYEDYVYDVSVPESQNFWGGTMPVLLHNSDERGIDVIRNKVKDFARTMAISDVPFKIIYLDECDSLTREAQQALRRTMENYANSCRFILSCNYSSKIIDPIQSRCAVFRFKPLEESQVTEIVKMIAKNEKLDIDSKSLKTLYTVSDGDVRKLENILQSCSVISKKIDDDVIYNLVSAARPKEVKEVLGIAIKGNFLKARDMLLDIMLKYGLSGIDIVKQIQKEIWGLEIEDSVKVELVDKCGEIEFRMVEGSDEFIQLESLIAYFVKNGK